METNGLTAEQIATMRRRLRGLDGADEERADAAARRILAGQTTGAKMFPDLLPWSDAACARPRMFGDLAAAAKTTEHNLPAPPQRTNSLGSRMFPDLAGERAR